MLKLLRLNIKIRYLKLSLRHNIFFVGFSSKYNNTSSHGRLKSVAPETFSADPNIVENRKGHWCFYWGQTEFYLMVKFF
jgi:hypothetical protein